MDNSELSNWRYLGVSNEIYIHEGRNWVVPIVTMLLMWMVWAQNEERGLMDDLQYDLQYDFCPSLPHTLQIFLFRFNCILLQYSIRIYIYEIINNDPLC